MNSFKLYGTNIIPDAVSHIPNSCNDACLNKCAAAGPQYCNAFKLLWNATALKCLETCPLHFQQYNEYCVESSVLPTSTSTCKSATATLYSSSISTSPAPNSSTSDHNYKIILAVVIGGVALIISIFISVPVIVFVVLKIRKKNQRLPGYPMMPVGNNENEIWKN